MTKHFEFDIDNGLKLVEVGIKNLINYMNDAPLDFEYLTGNFHYNLILSSLESLNILYNIDSTSYMEYTIITDKLFIICNIDTGAIKFIRSNNIYETKI